MEEKDVKPVGDVDLNVPTEGEAVKGQGEDTVMPTPEPMPKAPSEDTPAA